MARAARRTQAGFSLVETLVAASLLAVLAVAIYTGFQAIGKGANRARMSESMLLLAGEKLEIARDLRYQDVGLLGGLPAGRLARVESVVRGALTYTVTTTVRNVDLPFDGTIGGTPNDLSPADQKLVQVEVSCGACGVPTSTLSARIAPATGLETSTGNGALFVRAIDAAGLPVPQASVHVENQQRSPAIVIDDVTDNDGWLRIVDAPTGTAAYRITVTKSGYSTARTYTPGAAENPVPTVPHANVTSGTVTQISFAIDRLSTLEVKSVRPSCEAVGNVDFDLTGAKVIGLNVFKYDQGLTTDGSGELTRELEWDTYAADVTDPSWALVGTNPAQPFALLPGATQPLSLVVASRNPRALLVKVREAGSGLPVADASVSVSRSGYSSTKQTGQGSFSQTDWSTGSGIAAAGEEPTGFFASDGNVDYSSAPGELRLASFGAGYVPQGSVESSTFDAGTTTSFLALSWLPGAQPPLAGAESARFQVATNVELTPTSTWSYLGPDGGSGTYYASPGQAVAEANRYGRYLRYRALLSTADGSVTPSVSDVALTFAEGCAPAGQAYFAGLDSATYTVEVSLSGYQTATKSVQVTADWVETTVELSPL